MCTCVARLREALHVVSVKDGDIIIVDVRVIDPDTIAHIRLPNITKPVYVICVHPPRGVQLNLRDALCTVDLAVLKETVQYIEESTLMDAPAHRG